MSVYEFLKADIRRAAKRYPREEAIFISNRDVRAWFLEGIIDEIQYQEMKEYVKEVHQHEDLGRLGTSEI